MIFFDNVSQALSLLSNTLYLKVEKESGQQDSPSLSLFENEISDQPVYKKFSAGIVVENP